MLLYRQALQGQHSFQAEAGLCCQGLGYGDPVFVGPVAEDAQQVLFVGLGHIGAERTAQHFDREPVLVFGGEASDELGFRADDDGGTCRGVADVGDDLGGGAVSVHEPDDFLGGLGMDDDFGIRPIGAGGVDIGHGEVDVNGTETTPDNDADAIQVSGGQAAIGLAVVVDGDLFIRNAEVVGAVDPQMDVGEKEYFFLLVQSPLEDFGGIAGGAGAAAVTATEGFDAGGAIDIDDGEPAAAVLLEEGPGLVDDVRVGHVGHGTAGAGFRHIDRLARGGQDIGRFSHEMNAAEDDAFGGAGGGLAGQFQ